MKKILIASEPVSAYDAKTHLPSLIQRAENGERFIITRHGKPVAQLIPLDAAPVEVIQVGLDAAAALRLRLKKRGAQLNDVLELSHDGHRY